MIMPSSFLGSFPIFLMPFYLQRVQGYSPGQIGLIMVPNFPVLLIGIFSR